MEQFFIQEIEKSFQYVYRFHEEKAVTSQHRLKLFCGYMPSVHFPDRIPDSEIAQVVSAYFLLISVSYMRGSPVPGLCKVWREKIPQRSEDDFFPANLTLLNPKARGYLCYKKEKYK